VYVPPPVYGGYYGGWDYHDDDFFVGMVVGGAVVGAAAAASDEETTTTTTTTSTTSAYASLPCNPSVQVVSGVTYYQCGETWYVQAYGASGPIFMPTAPPTVPMPDTAAAPPPAP
jgi:hypothetical protein